MKARPLHLSHWPPAALRDALEGPPPTHVASHSCLLHAFELTRKRPTWRFAQRLNSIDQANCLQRCSCSGKREMCASGLNRFAANIFLLEAIAVSNEDSPFLTARGAPCSIGRVSNKASTESMSALASIRTRSRTPKNSEPVRNPPVLLRIRPQLALTNLYQQPVKTTPRVARDSRLLRGRSTFY